MIDGMANKPHSLSKYVIIPRMTQPTEKLYDADAYRTAFTAHVIACTQGDGGYDVVLDRTVFFPEAGGQTPDRGTLGEAVVRDVKIDDTGVIHHHTDAPLQEGAEVSGEIDWKHRFDNMQQHTGEHIFSGLICNRYHCNNVGFHLSDQTVTMDYDRAFTKEEIDGIEQAANEAIWRDLPIEIAFPDDEELKNIPYRSKKELSGQIRIVSIPFLPPGAEGKRLKGSEQVNDPSERPAYLDICACCAPHVHHTGEVGILKVLALQNYKGGVRVTIACGERAFRALTDTYLLLSGLARKLSTSPEEVPAQLEKLREECAGAKRRSAELAEAMLTEKLNRISSDIITNDTITTDIDSDTGVTSNISITNRSNTSEASGPNNKHLLLFENAMDVNSARRALNRWAEDHRGCCILLLGDDETGYQLLIAAGKADPDADARVPADRLKERLGIKCGGSREMVQGRVSSSRQEIEEALKGS